MAEREKPELIRAMEIDEQGNRRMKTVRLDSIKTAPASAGRRELGEGEKQVARDLWQRIGRTAMSGQNMKLDGWVEGFSVDLHPEDELRLWTRMADTTDSLWSEGVGRTRDELVDVVVRVSRGEIDIPAQVPGVTDKMVERVRAAFLATRREPAPLEGLPEAVVDKAGGAPIYSIWDLASAMSGNWRERESELLDLVREAEVILGLVRDGRASVFHGHDVLQQTASTGINEPAVVVAFLIAADKPSDDPEILTAAIQVLKE